MPTAPQHIPSEQSGPSWDDFMSFMRNYTQSDIGGIGNPAGGLEAFFAMLFSGGGDSFVLDPYLMSGGAQLESNARQIGMIGSDLGKVIESQRKKKQQKEDIQKTKKIEELPTTPATPTTPTTPTLIPPALPGQRPFPQSPQMYQRSRVQDQPPDMWSMPDQNLLRRWY